ncbi:MAG: Anaphase-promoting complex, cyclosome, subunit 3, partial [Acidobacteriota bacterium]|nr:Anaphase-promoting complex, cyclosome, subunit 3 [Acidobacteriota bacterium]
MKRLLCLLLLTFAALAQDVPPPAAAPPAVAPAADDEFTKSVYFGKKFADVGQYADAHEYFAKADALRPDQPGVLYNMAVVLTRAGRYGEAQGKIDRYNQLFPAGAEKPQVVKLQYELDFQRERQKKRQADQDYADLFNRARFLYGRGELAEAITQFQRAEQLRPNDPAAVFNEAVVYEKQGDFAKAIERYRRWAELETNPEERTGVDQRVYQLERELENMKTKIVCSFCGHMLPEGVTWCERCWHGPYLVKSAVWDSRPCIAGATATRTTYFSDERFNKNDVLPCLAQNGTLRETLRYSPARQRAIQDARKAEGWTYGNGYLTAKGDEVRYVQGPDYLEKVVSPTGGEILTYVAHGAGEGVWLLDREDLIVDAQTYVNHYDYDASGRIARQTVDYQNTAACNHFVSMKADYAYQENALMGATITSTTEGFVAEGKPTTTWTANVAWTYDAAARVAKEELTVTAFDKKYAEKAQGALRDDVGRLYTGMRVRKPIENVARVGDLCATSGTLLLSN